MVTLTDIVVSFRGRTVLNQLSCTFREGETTGIIGPNGSGKTTLFNCISGFVPCSAGSITLRDHEIHRLPAHVRAQRGLGRIFQNSGIFREMTVLENVVCALEAMTPGWRAHVPWSSASRALRARALEALGELGLTAKAHDRADTLSGGQLRLLEIARTVAAGADVFLLDEPTAGVSPRMKSEVAATIERLGRLGKTVLIIEHDIEFIQRFCRRIVVLEGGAIALDDTPARVRSDARLQEIYFGGARGAHS
jgi:ABC-type branched-subunit amino acid transport system ATPase component